MLLAVAGVEISDVRAVDATFPTEAVTKVPELVFRETAHPASGARLQVTSGRALLNLPRTPLLALPGHRRPAEIQRC